MENKHRNISTAEPLAGAIQTYIPFDNFIICSWKSMRGVIKRMDLLWDLVPPCRRLKGMPKRGPTFDKASSALLQIRFMENKMD